MRKTHRRIRADFFTATFSNFFLLGVIAASLLLFSCISAPPVVGTEQPEVLWTHNFKFTEYEIDSGVITLHNNVRKTVTEQTLDLTTGTVIDETSMSVQKPSKTPSDPDIEREQIIKSFYDNDLRLSIVKSADQIKADRFKETYDDLRLIKISTGETVQKFTRKKASIIDCMIDNDNLYLLYNPTRLALSENKKFPAYLVAHTIKTGEEVYKTELNKMEIKVRDKRFFNTSGIILHKDKIIIAAEGVDVIEKSSGKILWSVKNEATRRPSLATLSGLNPFGKFISDIDPTPLIADDTMIIRDVEGTYRLFDIESGKELWNKKIGWSDAAFIIGDSFYVSLGLSGYKVAKNVLVSATPDTSIAYKGTPGFAKYSVKDGSEIWRHEFKKGTSDMLAGNDKDIRLFFSDKKMYELNVVTGALNEKLDVGQAWGYKKGPISFMKGQKDNELLLFFSNELVWIDKTDLTVTTKLNLGMRVPETVKLSVMQIENSLMLVLSSNGDWPYYLYVLDAPSRTLRYAQRITSTCFEVVADKSMYIMANKTQTTLTAYRIR